MDAVLTLMSRNTTSNHNLYFSFSHDTDIVPIVPALGIFPGDPLPWDTYDADRVFWTTSVVPMGGHIVVERLDCGDTRVRLVVNGRVQLINDLADSTELTALGVYQLDAFTKAVRGKWEQGFCEACANGTEECIDGISFYDS